MAACWSYGLSCRLEIKTHQAGPRRQKRRRRRQPGHSVSRQGA